MRREAETAPLMDAIKRKAGLKPKQEYDPEADAIRQHERGRDYESIDDRDERKR